MKSNPVYTYGLLLLVALFCAYSCNETTTVGADLFEEEDIGLEFIDNLEVGAKVINQDAIPTSFPVNQLLLSDGTYLIGELTDPVFGKASAAINFELGSRSGLNFSDATLDSMVFIFQFAEDGFYGDTTFQHDITIEELDERIDVIDTLYSNQEFAVKPSLFDTPAASLSGYIPRRRDSVKIISHITQEEESLGPQMRMRLRDDIAQRIFQDTLNITTNSLISEVVNGFVLKSVPRNNNSFISLDLVNNNSSLEVFYTRGDSVPAVFSFPFSQVRHQAFTLDHSGTISESNQEVEIVNGESILVQGMSGVLSEIDLSSLTTIADKPINQAELRLYRADESLENERFFPPAERLIMTKSNNGAFLDDISFGFDAFRSESGIDFYFGGTLADTLSTNVDTYTMDITIYAKEVQKGREDGKVKLEVFQKISNPSRVVLYGPGHPTFAPELRITVTEE